jgi:tetratricopeptide (TPR) repeat protein
MSDARAGALAGILAEAEPDSDPAHIVVAASALAPAASLLPLRPQPLGTFPLPAGYLLVPPGEDTEAARAALLAGRVPSPWPARMRAHQLALAGDRDGALAELAGTGDDSVSRYNRFVLDPDNRGAPSGDAHSAGTVSVSHDLVRLRADLGEFAPLVDLVSFVLGRIPTPPDPGAADGEISALLLSAQAAHELAAGQPTEALRLLHQAARTARPVAPPLAGVMLGAAASICQEVFGLGDGAAAGSPGAAVLFEQALLALSGADDLRVSRAELHLGLAGALHELAVRQPEQLARAVPHYHSVLQLITLEQAPELWAAAHANLAAAYLAMPMTQASGELRLGVAVRSLRNALKVYTPQSHPEHWASTQLNLANSLVYAPSPRQEENLAEALELYEAVLEVRSRHTDPIGRARVLANQGDVLAHLGRFEPAKAKLAEARFLFEEYADGDSVRTVRGVLDEIARRQALLKNQGQGRT